MGRRMFLVCHNAISVVVVLPRSYVSVLEKAILLF